MAYENDIFLSYKRRAGWTPWVRDFFKNALEDYIGPLHPSLRIFVDEQVETGASWPLDLKVKLANSRLLIAVLSPEYFTSEWCVQEMAVFLEREQICGYRTLANTSGLVLPVQLHGNDYPSLIKTFQTRPMKMYAVRGINPMSPLGQQFDTEMRDWAPHIHEALCRVPPHDANWLNCTGSGFLDKLRRSAPDYNTPPRF